MDFADRTLSCLDCQSEFVFSAGEQAFYASKGFVEPPKRCKACRELRRAGADRDHDRDRDDEVAPSTVPYRNDDRDDGRDDGRLGRGARELFDATCASCGAAAHVPFRPASGRPVYCRDCYASRQAQGSRYGDDP